MDYSARSWKDKSNLENLKKELEKLVAATATVKLQIKEGEELLPNVEIWQNNANNIINEFSGLINPQQQNMQCCNGHICSDVSICSYRSDNVGRKLKDVVALLEEASKFNEVAFIPEETKYKIKLADLEKEVEKLVAKRDSVQHSIKDGEVPLPNVKVWQDKVKKIVDEVSGLTSKYNPDQQNNLARMLTEVARLLQEGAQFREVSYQPIPEQTCLQSSIQPVFLESRLLILKDIIAALVNTDVNMVGIYGMGGVGKTTLAKEVQNQAKQDKLFDKIVFAEVSQSPDIRTIQGVIADYLGLKLHEETVSGRAGRLCGKLKQEKNILIILDNVWKGIKLEEVGIPFGNNSKGLKLLLTARSYDVLTNDMESQRNFHVEALSKVDGWSLFKNIAGACIDHPNLKSIAQEVAKKCGGMPIAIVTIAKALKNKSEDEWRDALLRLNNPSSESFEGYTKEVYN